MFYLLGVQQRALLLKEINHAHEQFYLSLDYIAIIYDPRDGGVSCLDDFRVDTAH